MSCTGTVRLPLRLLLRHQRADAAGRATSAGLPAIAYRTGTWATFKESMLARLSSADYPALAALKTRDDDDFSIALLDASSVMLDILTFYQERLANESYLRTATQLPSLTELARLIGYQPAPGVGVVGLSVVHVAGRAGLARRSDHHGDHHPEGTQVQSVPAQGQTPQTFETSADILAKADWNALPVQTGVPWMPQDGRPERLPARHGDAVAAGRRDPDRRRRAATADPAPIRTGTCASSTVGAGRHREASARYVDLERGASGDGGGIAAAQQEPEVLCAAPARVALRIQRRRIR